MGRQTGIYFANTTIEAVDNRKKGSVSGRINNIVERYSALLLTASPIIMTADERQILTFYLNGIPKLNLPLLLSTADQLSRSIYMDSSACQSLVVKMKGANAADIIATIESMGY